jgi:hypothetical protein
MSISLFIILEIQNSMRLFSTRIAALCLLISSICLSGCTPILFNDQKPENTLDCEKEKGVQLVLHETTLRPDKVTRGDEITVAIVYAVACAPESGVLIREKKALWYQGKQLKILTDANANRMDGTWESSITFRTPKSAQSGRYEVRQNMISGGDTILSTASVFTLTD